MPKATYKGVVLAQSAHTERVEGNHYFPPEAINRAHFQPSDHHTICPWKGKASYYHIIVGDEVVKNGAWYYPEPKAAAANIKNHVAFYGMVNVEN